MLKTGRILAMCIFTSFISSFHVCNKSVLIVVAVIVVVVVVVVVVVAVVLVLVVVVVVVISVVLKLEVEAVKKSKKSKKLSVAKKQPTEVEAEACIFINKKTLAHVFSCEFSEIFKNTFLESFTQRCSVKSCS